MSGTCREQGDGIASPAKVAEEDHLREGRDVRISAPIGRRLKLTQFLCSPALHAP